MTVLCTHKAEMLPCKNIFLLVDTLPPPSPPWICTILIYFDLKMAHFTKRWGLCITVYKAKKEKKQKKIVCPRRQGMKQRACLWARLLSICMYTACSIRTIGGRLHFPSWWSDYVTSGVGSYWRSYWWEKSRVTRRVWSADYSEMLQKEVNRVSEWVAELNTVCVIHTAHKFASNA